MIKYKSNGYDLKDLNIILINDSAALGANNENFKGNFNQDTNTITLNLANLKGLDDLFNTYGHELSHAVKSNQNKFIPQDTNQNSYANFKGSSLTDFMNKALNLRDYGSLNSYDLNLDYANSSNLNTLMNNQSYFNSMDKSKSDNVDLNYMNSNEFGYTYVNYKDKIFTDKDNVITIGGHGSSGIMLDGTNATSVTDIYPQLDIKKLAQDIRQTDKWKSGKVDLVELYVCYSATPSNIELSVAQQLANELGIPVAGYTGEYGFNRDIFGNINQYYGIPLNDGPVKGGKRVIIKPNLGGKNE